MIFSLKNFFVKTIFIALFLVNTPCLATTEISSNEEISAQETYYKEYPWDYIEKKLTTEPKNNIGGLNKSIMVANFIAIQALAFVLTYTIIFQAAERAAKIQTESQNILSLAAIGCMTLFFVGTSIGNICFYRYCAESSFKIEQLKNLIKILDGYNPDLSQINKQNTKNYIPERLHSTFDSLWTGYKKHGFKKLNEDWDKIRDQISKPPRVI